jgi:hypothetical protein
LETGKSRLQVDVHLFSSVLGFELIVVEVGVAQVHVSKAARYFMHPFFPFLGQGQFCVNVRRPQLEAPLAER